MLRMMKIDFAALQKPTKTGLGDTPGPSIEMATMKRREAWLIGDDLDWVKQFRRAIGAANGTDSPADTDPAETGPTDSDPVDSGPTDTDPDETGPTDSGPADSGPIDTDPAETGPTDSGPVDSGPTETGPADNSPA